MRGSHPKLFYADGGARYSITHDVWISPQIAHNGRAELSARAVALAVREAISRNLSLCRCLFTRRAQHTT
jgi:hypothetical protein